MLSELRCAFSVVLPFNIEGNHEKLMLASKIIKDSDKLLWLSRFREMPWLYNSVLVQILRACLAILCWFITSPSNANINGLNNFYESLDKYLAHLNLQDFCCIKSLSIVSRTVSKKVSLSHWDQTLFSTICAPPPPQHSSNANSEITTVLLLLEALYLYFPNNLHRLNQIWFLLNQILRC